MDSPSSSVNSKPVENQDNENIFNHMERQFERDYQNLQNMLQNSGSIDQVERFVAISRYVFNYYGDALKKKIDELEKLAKSLKEKNSRNAIRADSIINQGEEAILQNKEFLIEMYGQADEIEKRSTKISREIAMFRQLNIKIEQKKFENARQVLQVTANLPQQRHNGLTPERIQRFQLFTADETHVGDQCSICLENVEVGKLMRRLTCDGQHCFCQSCIESWFADHNTCPLCRHAFV